MGSIETNAHQLFNRLNRNWTNFGEYDKTKSPEVLDAEEVKDAKNAGFTIFNLHDGMTETEFYDAYNKYTNEHQNDLSELNKQERNVHVKYIQLRYHTSEEIKDGESVEEYEARIANAYNEGLNDAIEAELAKIPGFGLEQDPKPNETKRISYAKAMSLVKQIGQTLKDGGSKQCSIETPEGKIEIFLDNSLGSKRNGYLTIIYPDHTIEAYDANGQPVKDDFLHREDENDPQGYIPPFTEKPNIHNHSWEPTEPDPTMIRDPKTHDW